MARGGDPPAMEMTKWFDTNYHYIVPEFEADTDFRLAPRRPSTEFCEARAAGIHTRPVLLGPVSFLHLGKERGLSSPRLSLLPALLPVYEQVLDRLAGEGADWIQMDEPCLALDPDAVIADGLRDGLCPARARVVPAEARAHRVLRGAGRQSRPRLRAAGGGRPPRSRPRPGQIDAALTLAQARRMSLSLGLVDGRNVWRTDLFQAAVIVACAREKIGSDRILVAPSCSLMHCPIELCERDAARPDDPSWLAFAAEKLDEVALLARHRDARRGRHAVRELRRQRARAGVPRIVAARPRARKCGGAWRRSSLTSATGR